MKRSLALAAMLAGVLAIPGFALDFTVSNNEDEGPGSLRQAILDANAAGGDNRVVWAGTGGEIVLASDLPGITSAITFDAGAASAPVVLRGRAYLSDDPAASLNLGGVDIVLGSLDGAGPSGGNVDLAAAALTTGADDTDSYFGGVLSGEGGSLVKIGYGTFALDGVNTYTGGTAINGGTLAVLDDSALGDAAGALSFANGGMLSFEGGDGSSARAITLNEGGGVIGSGGNMLELSGNITGAGELMLGADRENTSDDGGWFLISGASNTYSGGTFIHGVIASAGGENVFGTGRVELECSDDADWAVLDLNGYAQTIGSLAGDWDSDVYLNGADLTVGADGTDSEYNGYIEGDGRLIKVGAGTLSLNGYDVNDYQGGTSINGGTLAVAYDDQLGSGDLSFNGGTMKALNDLSSSRSVLLEDGGGTFDSAGYTITLAGDISGSGALTAVDSGEAAPETLVLQGTNNTYTGGTYIYGSTLRAEAAYTLPAAGAVTLAGNGYSYFAELDMQGYDQTIGSLSGDAESLVLLGEGTTLATGGNGDSTVFNGVISGDGSLIKQGDGTFTLGGLNDYTGGTTVEGGALRISDVDNLGEGDLTLNGGTLQASNDLYSSRSVILGENGGAFDSAGYSIDFNGMITGEGSLVKQGDGVFNLGGLNDYLGATTVEGGTLRLGTSGTLPSTTFLTVSEGAGLDVNDRDQTVDSMMNAGTTRLKTGSLSVSGNYSGGGELETTLAGDAVFGRLNVLGDADLTGGTLRVVLSGPYLPGNDRIFDFLQAGNVIGEFASFFQPAALRFDPIYTETSVSLMVTEIPFTDIPVNPDNAGLAGALETVRDDPAMEDVVIGLINMDRDEFLSALEQMSPKSLAGLTRVGIDNAGIGAAGLGPRLAALREAGGGGAFSLYDGRRQKPILLAYNGNDLSHFGVVGSQAPAGPWGFYASGTGSFGSLDSYDAPEGRQVGYEFHTGGLSAGMDYRIADRQALGLFLGYEATGGDMDGGAGTFDVDQFRLGLYTATFHERGFYANAYAGLGLNQYETRRHVAFGGIDSTADGDPSGRQWEAEVELGFDHRTKAATLTPLVSAAYTGVTVDAYTETGAGALNLYIAERTAESFRTRLGGRLSRRFKGGTRIFEPNLAVSWEHEYLDQSQSIDAQFASAGAGAFTVETADAGRDAAVLGLGLLLHWTPALTLNATYTNEAGRTHFTNHEFQAGLSWRF